MSDRFSKATLAHYIAENIQRIQSTYNFRWDTGTAQIAQSNDAAQRAYGELYALYDLAEHFDIAWSTAARAIAERKS